MDHVQLVFRPCFKIFLLYVSPANCLIFDRTAVVMSRIMLKWSLFVLPCYPGLKSSFHSEQW